MTAKVAVVDVGKSTLDSLRDALDLIGGIEDLNNPKRPVIVKVGVFDPDAGGHTTVEVAGAIAASFTESPRIFIVESDNYRGSGMDRLQLWKEIFKDRTDPFNLSDDPETKKVLAAGEELRLSHLLFKPNVFVSTHILRKFERGSILKNLLGLVPDRGKARFHRRLEELLADLYEAIGGIDLAVLDGTYLRGGAAADPHAIEETVQDMEKMNVVIVGRDAVAVEAVGMLISGIQPEKTALIQEFTRRGLGEGTLENIEVVGASTADLKIRFSSVSREQRANARKNPSLTWGGRAHRAIQSLVDDGFFNLPNERTAEEVAKALENRGISPSEKEENIAGMLSRKARRGVLKTGKSPKGRIYWKE